MTESRSVKAPAPLTPFKPGTAKFEGKPLDFNTLAPQQEPEPKINAGIDLSNRPKIVMAVGRGKTGKTTLLRWVAEMSFEQASSPILADIDPSNQSFSRYFKDAIRPETDHPAGVAKWLQELFEHCVTYQRSAIVDLGGGDTTLRTLASEMPGLASHLETNGVSPVLLHLAGPQPEDLTPSNTLISRGFSPAAQALILNEFSIEPGGTRHATFASTLQSSAGLTLTEASVIVWMPKLHSADAVEKRQCRYIAARDGQVNPPLGMFDAARLRVWLDTMNRRFAGISSWIP
jgi:hypothetical protein